MASWDIHYLFHGALFMSMNRQHTTPNGQTHAPKRSSQLHGSWAAGDQARMQIRSELGFTFSRPLPGWPTTPLLYSLMAERKCDCFGPVQVRESPGPGPALPTSPPCHRKRGIGRPVFAGLPSPTHSPIFSPPAQQPWLKPRPTPRPPPSASGLPERYRGKVWHVADHDSVCDSAQQGCLILVI